MTYWYRRIATRILVYGIIFGMGILVGSARAEQLDPKKLTEQIAEQYVKELVKIDHFALGIDLPEQVDISIKQSQYQFQHGGNITIKHRDPTRITYQYQQGNHNLSIREDHIGFHFTKQFNWTR